MNRNTQSGLTIPEVLVILFILAVLFLVTVPEYPGPFVKRQQTEMLSNMKQLHSATLQMALDSTTTGDTNNGWPGDTGGSYATWQSNLITGKYLSSTNFCRLIAEPPKQDRDWSPKHIWSSLFGAPAPIVPVANTNAVLVYAVRETSDGAAVFLSSANFTNSPTGGLPPSANGVLFGQKGFVIFHKAGDGVILANRQVGQTNLIGTYVPLCQ